MKTLHLIKFVDHIQLGHLYEHLFLFQLSDMLRKKGLFAYIDYGTEGETYHKGVVYVTIRLYTPVAIKLVPEVIAFTPDFTKQSLAIGLQQICAEKIMRVESYDYEQALAKLRKIQAATWIEAETFGIEDGNKPLKTETGLTLKKVSDRTVLYLSQTIELDPIFAKQDRLRYVPIFYVISHVLFANFQDVMGEECGLYSRDEIYNYSSGTYRETNRYLAYERHTLRDEQEVAKAFIRSCFVNNFAAKLAEQLRAATLSEPFRSFDDHGLLDRTGIAVGSKGWQQLADPQPIQEVLKALTITHRIGRRASRFRVADLQ